MGGMLHRLVPTGNGPTNDGRVYALLFVRKGRNNQIVVSSVMGCAVRFEVSKFLVIEKGACVVALGCKSKASTSDLVIVVLGILGTAPWLHFERPA